MIEKKHVVAPDSRPGKPRRRKPRSAPLILSEGMHDTKGRRPDIKFTALKPMLGQLGFLSPTSFSQIPKVGLSSSEVEMIGSLVDPTVRYKLRFSHSIGQVSANGSGIVAGFATADPSGNSGSSWTADEWSACSSIFATVRCVRFEVWFAFAITTVTAQGNPWLAVGSQVSTLTVNPTVASQALGCSDSEVHAPHLYSSVNVSKHHYKLDTRVLEFASVNTPNPGTYAGCPGTIVWYGAGYGASTVALSQFNVGFYEFMGRL